MLCDLAQAHVRDDDHSGLIQEFRGIQLLRWRALGMMLFRGLRINTRQRIRWIWATLPMQFKIGRESNMIQPFVVNQVWNQAQSSGETAAFQWYVGQLVPSSTHCCSRHNRQTSWVSAQASPWVAGVSPNDTHKSRRQWTHCLKVGGWKGSPCRGNEQLHTLPTRKLYLRFLARLEVARRPCISSALAGVRVKPVVF